MIRLFTAIDLPESITPLIGSLGGTIPGSRPVPADQLHLTLKFIGEVDTAMLPDIREALHTIRMAPLTLALQGVGHFPPRGTPKVIWAGVTPVTELVLLRNKVEKALFDIGIARERRKFSPHLTLCRLRDSPIGRVSRFLAENSHFATPPFTVDEFRLYSSILSNKGAVHTVEEILPLDL